MSHSWLQRKRKSELLELAQRANVFEADTLLKDDLVAALVETLDANQDEYAQDPLLGGYWAGRGASPIKRERSSPFEGFPAVATKTTRRRQTITKTAEPEELTPEKPKMAVATRTPRPVSRVVSRVADVDLPASPAQLAEIADQSFQAAKTRASEIWDKTRIDEAKEFVRELVSSVSAIQTLILVVEAVGLQYNTLQDTHILFDTPAVDNYFVSREVRIPNLAKLLGSGWWAPATLWSLTNWALPLVVSYFFNLTLRTNTRHKSSRSEYTIDPFTFNITKAILAYSAYCVFTTADASLAAQPNVVVAQDLGWGPFSAESVSTIRNNVPGGYYGIQIGSLVGLLVSLYDAALKK